MAEDKATGTTVGTATAIRSFEDLDCWKACREVRQFAARIARSLPADERFRLTDQMLRSARSTTANIAEGYGRFHYQENLQFCRQARGSLYETLEHVMAGHDEGLIAEGDLLRFRQMFDRAVGILNGYIYYLDRAARATRAASRPQVSSRVAEDACPYDVCENAPIFPAPAND